MLRCRFVPSSSFSVTAATTAVTIAVSSSTPISTTAKRTYYHDIPKDLVPEGMRTSRFQSSLTPRQRTDAQIEYGVLTPAFGGNNCGQQFPLVTLAINDRINGPAFSTRFRKGLTERLNQVSQVDKVAYEVVMEKAKEIVKTDDANSLLLTKITSAYRKSNKFYEITTGMTIDSRNAPWNGSNRNLMKKELPYDILPIFNRINQRCMGLEVCLNITSSRNKWRRHGKVNPENWIEQQQQEQQDPEQEASNAHGGGQGEVDENVKNANTTLLEKQLEIDLEIFARCQENILRAINYNDHNISHQENDDGGALLVSFSNLHGIVHAIPGSLPEGIESFPEQYNGVPLSDKTISNAQKLWKERVERFNSE